MKTEVNFKLAGGTNPLILVPAYVNNQGPFEFILDTGASISFLSKELTQKLEIHATEFKEGAGVGGKVQFAISSAGSLAIGNARIENSPIAIMEEIHRISSVVGAKIDGVIGYSFLKSFQLIIDYQKNIFRLTRAEQNHSGNSKSSEIKFKLALPSKPLILVPVYANGKGPYQFALDTGASITVLSTEVARSLGIENVGTCDTTGVGGLVKASVASIKSFAVGSVQLQNLSAAVTNALHQLSQAAKTDLEGIVGYN